MTIFHPQIYGQNLKFTETPHNYRRVLELIPLLSLVIQKTKQE